jgi:hypothetical protein
VKTRFNSWAERDLRLFFFFLFFWVDRCKKDKFCKLLSIEMECIFIQNNMFDYNVQFLVGCFSFSFFFS